MLPGNRKQPPFPLFFLLSFFSEASIKGERKRKATERSSKSNIPLWCRIFVVCHTVSSWKYALHLFFFYGFNAVYIDRIQTGALPTSSYFSNAHIPERVAQRCRVFWCGNSGYNHFYFLVVTVQSHKRASSEESLTTSALKFHICHRGLAQLNGHFTRRHQHKPFLHMNAQTRRSLGCHCPHLWFSVWQNTTAVLGGKKSFLSKLPTKIVFWIHLRGEIGLAAGF